jgi:hypothetical protein
MKLTGTTRTFQTGSGEERPFRVVLNTADPLQTVTRIGDYKEFASTARLQKVGFYVMSQPYLAQEIWTGMARNIVELIRDWDRNKSVKWLSVFQQLDYTMTDSLDEEAVAQAIVEKVASIHYKTQEFIIRLVEALNLINLRSFPVAERIRGNIRFSRLNSMLTVLESFPINRDYLLSIVDRMRLMVHDGGINGSTIAFPHVLPLEEVYFDRPCTKAEIADGLSGLRSPGVQRLRTVQEMGKDATGRAGFTFEELFLTKNASGSYNLPSNGYIAERVLRNLVAARDDLLNSFSPELSAQNAVLREFLIDLGYFTHTFELVDFSDVVRSQKPYDLKDYFKVNAYGAHIGGVQAKTKEPYTSENLPPSLRVKRTGATPAEQRDNRKKFITNKKIRDLILEARAAGEYAVKQLDAQYAALFPKNQAAVDMVTTEGRIPPLSNGSGDADATPGMYLHGFDPADGALDPDADNTAYIDDETRRHYGAGAKYAANSLRSLGTNSKLYVEEGVDPMSMVSNDEFLNIMESHYGVIRPRKLITPMVNPHDVFQHGLFMIASVEDVHPGLKEGAVNWAAWLTDGFKVPAGWAAADLPKLVDVQPSAPLGALMLSNLKDVLLFMGDDIDSSPITHFSRGDLSTYSSVPYKPAYDLGVLDGAETSPEDYTPGSLLFKPYVSFYESGSFAGHPVEVGFPYIGIDMDNASGFTPVYYPSREIFNNEVTISGIFGVIGDLLFGSISNIGDLIKSVFSWKGVGFTNIRSNNFLKSADVRRAAGALFTSPMYPSPLRLIPKTLLGVISNLESRNKDNEVIVYDPKDVASVLPAISVATGEITEGLADLADFKFMLDDKRSNSRNSGRGSKSRSGRWSDKGGKPKGKSGGKSYSKDKPSGSTNVKTYMKPESQEQIGDNESKTGYPKLDDDSKIDGKPYDEDSRERETDDDRKKRKK